MRFAHPLLAATAVLALLIATCSTPEDLSAPTLEPQLGSPQDNYANVVTADAARGRVYVAGEHTPYDEEFNKPRGNMLFFRRYDRGGRLV